MEQSLSQYCEADGETDMKGKLKVGWERCWSTSAAETNQGQEHQKMTVI